MPDSIDHSATTRPIPPWTGVMSFSWSYRTLRGLETIAVSDALVLVISGSARVGKTTLARQLAQRLDLPRLEYGRAKKLNDAQTLQDIADRRGAIIDAQDVANVTELRHFFAAPFAHIHLRRHGDMLVDTTVAPHIVNLSNRDTVTGIEADALAWLRRSGLLLETELARAAA